MNRDYKSLLSCLMTALLLFAGAWGATRTWDNGGSDNKWSTAANWSDNTKPTASDNAVFDATSTDSCYIDEDISIDTMRIAAAYTGGIRSNGRTMTLAGSMIDSGNGGWRDWCNAIKVRFTGTNDVAKFSSQIREPVGNNVSVCTLSIEGTGFTYYDYKGFAWDNFNFPVADVKAVSAGTYTIARSPSGTTLRMSDRNKFTLNTSGVDQFIKNSNGKFFAVGQNDTVDMGGGLVQFMAGAANLIDTVVDGFFINGTFRLEPAGGGFTGCKFYLCCVKGNANVGFNDNFVGDTKYYLLDTIICGNLTVASKTAGKYCNVYADGAYIDINGTFSGDPVSGKCSLFCETAEIFIAGDDDRLGMITVPGTSTVTYDGTTACTPSGTNLLYYDVVINKTSNGVTMQNDATVNGDFTHTAGTFSQNANKLTVAGDVAINSAGAGTWNDTLVAAGDITVGASSAPTTTGATWTTTADGAIITTNGKALPQLTTTNNATINDGCTIARLIPADGKTLTLEAGETFAVSAYTSGDWNGTAGNLVKWVSSSPGTAYTIAIPSAITASYNNPTDFTASGYTITAIDGTSLDGGNNTGWIFPTGGNTDQFSPFARTRYFNNAYRGNTFARGAYR
jgi:hypothetical protein